MSIEGKIQVGDKVRDNYGDLFKIVDIHGRGINRRVKFDKPRRGNFYYQVGRLRRFFTRATR